MGTMRCVSQRSSRKNEDRGQQSDLKTKCTYDWPCTRLSRVLIASRSHWKACDDSCSRPKFEMKGK